MHCQFSDVTIFRNGLQDINLVLKVVAIPELKLYVVVDGTSLERLCDQLWLERYYIFFRKKYFVNRDKTPSTSQLKEIFIGRHGRSDAKLPHRSV